VLRILQRECPPPEETDEICRNISDAFEDLSEVCPPEPCPPVEPTEADEVDLPQDAAALLGVLMLEDDKPQTEAAILLGQIMKKPR
jgi:hypothetical protein